MLFNMFIGNFRKYFLSILYMRTIETVLNVVCNMK